MSGFSWFNLGQAHQPSLRVINWMEGYYIYCNNAQYKSNRRKGIKL